MATVTLYVNKINQMPELIRDIKKSVIDYKSELLALKNKSLSINKSICNLDVVVSSIQSSSQTQDQKISSLEMFSQSNEQFLSDSVRIDGDVAALINQCKDDFYDKYYYLKPECEKSGWERSCDGVKSVGEWCREHWKLLITVALVVVAIALICTGVGGILGAMALGALWGAGIGGVLGGTLSALQGGSFCEGFENGAFSGAISGIISGGMGLAMIGGATGASAGVTLALWQTLLVGGVSGMGASLINDLGDIFIKGENISFKQVLLNMGISGVLGAAFAGIGYGISKGISALKVKLGGKVTPLENGPYIKDGKPNGRPGPSGEAKVDFEQAVYKNQTGKNGVLRDSNTGKVLDWKPGQPRTGKVDFGHNPGKNYSKIFEWYKNGKVSLEQLKKFQSNPKNFRIEGISSNRGHLFENTIFEITKGFPWLSSASNTWRELVREN